MAIDDERFAQVDSSDRERVGGSRHCAAPAADSTPQRQNRHRGIGTPENGAANILTDEDLLLVRSRRGNTNRLRLAVQVCLLRSPGIALTPNQTVPQLVES